MSLHLSRKRACFAEPVLELTCLLLLREMMVNTGVSPFKIILTGIIPQSIKIAINLWLKFVYRVGLPGDLGISEWFAEKSLEFPKYTAYCDFAVLE